MNLKRPERPEIYAVTSVSHRIEKACSFAIAFTGVAVVRGSSGIGKTAAIAEYCKKNQNAVAFEVVQQRKSMKGIIESLADAFDVSTYKSFTSEIYDILTYRLSDAARGGKIMIVDEVQNCGVDGVRMLTELQEQCKFPMVLVGNPVAIKRTNGNAAVFDQIHSRVGKWTELGRATAEDIQLIGIEYQVEGKGAYDAIISYGCRKSIREAARLLQAARKIAGPQGSVRIDHIQDAAVFLHDNRNEALRLLKPAA